MYPMQLVVTGLGSGANSYFLAGDPCGPSTPKSHTYRFIPSGRISASAYSPGGKGSPSVNRYTVAATSHRWIAIEFRSTPKSCPNMRRIDLGVERDSIAIQRWAATATVY